MYDTDEEIKRKRRNLFIIIGIIVFLILILIIFLLTRGSGKKKNVVDNNIELTCELEVKNDVKPNSNGVYNQQVEVGFKNIGNVSKDYPLTKQTVGTSDSSRNKDTYSISKTGIYHLHGYVQDSVGHKGICDLDIEVSLTKPSCELQVTQGTLGDNYWFRSDVEVGFKEMSSNNPSNSIVKYYIEKQITDLDSNETVRAEQPNGNIEKYVIKDNLTTTLIGHVIDSTGEEGTCTIVVNKDSTIPTCKLKVNSGTKNENGEYTDEPVIGFEEVKDDVSQVASVGIGISKNYNTQTYKVTKEGKTTVVGYVKDKAGNEGTCSIEIAKPTANSGNPGGNSGGNGGNPGGNSGGNGGETPVKSSKPYCTLTLSGIAADSSGSYPDNITVTMTYGSTNGAVITSFGVAETETYNQRNQIVVSQNGTHTVYGIAKDSYGHVVKCVTGPFVISKSELLAAKVSIGDYVAYDAGNWDEESRLTEKQQDGYYWGFTKGTSKQTGVMCAKRKDTGTRNGWMVLNVINGQVVLIHAGTPECVFHDRVSTSNVVNVMLERSKHYINSKYATGSTILSCDTAGFDCNRTQYSLANFVTGSSYWIAQNGENNTLFSINNRGLKEGLSYTSSGLRPIVVLSQNVRTTGKSGNAWIIK